MDRRDFLKLGAAGAAGVAGSNVLLSGASAAGAAERSAPESSVVVSTWRFGLEANQQAVKTLSAGGTPLDAVEQGVRVVEADPEVTSVGYGGVPNRDGVVELDAAVMVGEDLAAGSVAGLHQIMHPVSVARQVMEQTRHVLLVGDGARRFAAEKGFESENLLTEKALAEWQRIRGGGKSEPSDDHDTIGMVALAADGRMAAACTTSGMAGKIPGRVGDSPLIGHGLYCDSEVGGAVATGVGEEVIRVCGSYQVVEFMRQGVEPDEAVRRVVKRALRGRKANDDLWIGFVALRKDGAVGYGASGPDLEVAISRGDRHEVVPGPIVG